MKLFRKIKELVNTYPLAFVLIIFVVIYFPSIKIFFQQDDWFGMSQVIGHKERLIFHRFQLGEVNHFVPLNMLIEYISFKFVGLNHIIYNILGLTIHFINGVLIFKIAKRLNINKFGALVTILLFLLSSNSSEFVMWPFISLNLLAFTLAFISFYILLLYINNNSFLLLLISNILLIASLFTLEYTASFIVIFPLAVILLKNKNRFDKKFIILFIFSVMGYFFIRFLPFLSEKSSQNEALQTSIFSLILKLLKFPSTYIFQAIVPEAILTPLIKISGQQLNIPERFIANIFAIFGFIIILLSLRYARKYFNKSNSLLLICIWLISSSLPFIAIPNLESDIIFSPRYLYLGIAGISLFIGLLLKGISRRKTIVGIAIVLIWFGLVGNISRISKLDLYSTQRIKILTTIKDSYPSLPAKSIIFVESDTSYYGMPNDTKILPFQSGFGKTLIVWYYKEHPLPNEFYTSRYLWELTDEGYKTVNDKGFGYFRDYELLKKTVEQYNVPIDAVYAFSWNSEKGEIINITSIIQEKLRQVK